MSTVRDIARVTPIEPVPNKTRARKKAPAARRRARGPLTKDITVDRRVMEAAKVAMRPGQRLVIVDEQTVRLVNS